MDNVKTNKKTQMFVCFSAMGAFGGDPWRLRGQSRGVDQVFVAAVYVRRSLGRAITGSEFGPGPSLGASGGYLGQPRAVQEGTGRAQGTQKVPETLQI